MASGGGGWWRRWRGAADPPAQDEGAATAGRAPIVRRGWRHTDLQFAGGVSQSRMRTFQPGHLLIDYTRTMMASLLFRPQPTLIGIIGLGGGSQVKFCHRQLPSARIEVAENNPQVVALRKTFRIPRDDRRLQVSVVDGAAFVQAHRGRFDILLVDGYDETGIPAALSTQRFYDDCRDALRPGGVMASNLYATDFAAHLDKLRRSFGHRRVLVLEEARQSNRVAFAWTGDPFAQGHIDLPGITAQVPAGARRELQAVFAAFARAWAAR